MSNLAYNRSSSYEFQILEELEAGLVLTGHEVKSAKNSHISLKGAFISIKNGEAWLKNMHISAYDKASSQSLANYNPTRDRRLLLSKKQIGYLANKSDNKGLTIIPISVYTSRRLVKVKIALVKGKKKFDKRETIKKRDVKRIIASKLKSH